MKRRLEQSLSDPMREKLGHFLNISRKSKVVFNMYSLGSQDALDHAVPREFLQEVLTAFGSLGHSLLHLLEHSSHSKKYPFTCSELFRFKKTARKFIFKTSGFFYSNTSGATDSRSPSICSSTTTIHIAKQQLEAIPGIKISKCNLHLLSVHKGTVLQKCDDSKLGFRSSHRHFRILAPKTASGIKLMHRC
uniref:Ubiquitin-like domain-containing protein n=1 Tax=Caenorhabditis tropicalis TaxID=1561998 RepID=A0A1I7UTM4_9PELO